MIINYNVGKNIYLQKYVSLMHIIYIMNHIYKCPLILFTLFCVGASAQVRMDSYGDTLKGNIKKITQHGRFEIASPDGLYTSTVKCIYTCDTSRDIELIKYYKEQDKEAAREEIHFDSHGRILTDNAYTDIDSLYKRSTYTYDEQGLLIEKREINYPFHSGYQMEDAELGTGFQDSLGKCTKYAYDNKGRLAEKIELEIWDSRIKTDNLAAYKYDAANRKTEEYELNLRACFEDERYVLFYTGGKGYAKKAVFTYDSLNRLASCTKYSELKVPNPSWHEKHTGIFIGWKTVYNYSGKNAVADDLTSMSLFREDNGAITTGTPSTDLNHAAETYETLEYDKHGNVIRKMRHGQLVFERTIEYY